MSLAGSQKRLGWLGSGCAVAVLLLSLRPLSAQTSGTEEQSVGSTARVTSCPGDAADARRSLDTAPLDAAAELSLARSLAACRQFAEAVAHYQRILEVQPASASVLIELGETLLGAGRAAEAVPLFRQALELVPGSPPAALGLARALAATGDYQEALLRYDECLQNLPDDYGALQGKAYVLYWMRRYPEAQALFQYVQARRPDDPQNADALQDINRAEEEAHWAGLRPPAGSAPAEFLRYYQERLERDPHQHAAMMGLARTQVDMGEQAAAIQTFSRVVAAYPNDSDAKVELARLLGWNHQYDEAARLYQEVLSTAPDDTEALEGLARVLNWSGHLREAAKVYKRLLSLSPDNANYAYELASLQSRLGSLGEARQTLASLLARDPGNRAARLLLARIEVQQGDYGDALKHFQRLLKQNPGDFDARLGEAQVYYYRDKLGRARALATPLRQQQPDNFDVIFLLASIERASQKRHAAAALLAQCDQLSPNNPEVTALREKVRDESPAVLHTTVAFARETNGPTELGYPALNNFVFGATMDLAWLPRTESSLSLSYLPSTTQALTAGPSAGPSEFLYRQSTRLWPLLSVRGGVGLVRFGSGDSQLLPGNPNLVPSATLSPIGFVGFSLFPRRDLSFDLNWTRSAITYTPLAVSLGDIAEEVEGTLNYFPAPRTELHLNYHQGLYFSQTYEHLHYGIAGHDLVPISDVHADHQRGRGGSIVFNQKIIRSRRLAWDLGYWGLAFGFSAHPPIYMGFFAPSFYQRQLLTTRLQGRLRGPVGYDFSGGFGFQQIEQGQPLTRALTLSPALTLRASRQLSLRVQYTHYDSAPSWGRVNGNAVLLATDYRF